MRSAVLFTLGALCACGSAASPTAPSTAPIAASDAPTLTAPSHVPDAPGAAPVAPVAPVGDLPPHDTYDDLATALTTIIPPDARLIGFGEIHARLDRAKVKSALSRFTTDGLPAIASKLSDLVVETWFIEPKCGEQAATASAKVETTMRRPAETKSEITLLAEAVRAASIQPHAMKLACSDFDKVAPKGKDVDPEALLNLTTRELGRISVEATLHRDREPNHKPWIAVYGGALHNDRFPDPALAEWSYAKKADAATHDHFVEIDLIVPEFAEADASSKKQPWFPLVVGAAAPSSPKVTVWKRGDRSFVIVLSRAVAP